jgi:ubiquinone/menaquinone biosynthesis C-methylase UbiE
MSSDNRDRHIAREFDRTAEGYDDSRIVRSYQRRAQHLAICRLHLDKGMSILDLGCGTGMGTIDIARQLEGTGRVVGVDLSEKMIEQAGRKLDAIEYGNVEFRVGTAATLDYDAHFDCVLSTNAFHHFEEKGAVFRTIWRALKRGGVFVVQDICDDYLLMKLVDLAGKLGEMAHVGSTTSDGLRTLYLQSDFSDVEIEKLRLNWFWGIMIGEGKRPEG